MIGLIAPGLLLCAAGCASEHYAGIRLDPGSAPADIQALARAARGGDKQAQLALGERYERGDGVPRDADIAADLYRSAATDSGGTRMIFVPRGAGGVTAVPVNTGAAVPGLEEARVRLTAMPAGGATPSAADTQTTRRTEPPPSRRRVHGRLYLLGPSDACTTRRAVIQTVSAFRITNCVAQRYRLEPNSGGLVELVDLALTTDDDAIRSLPIPSRLFDALLGIDAPEGATGTISYDTAGIGREQINILRAFVEGR